MAVPMTGRIANFDDLDPLRGRTGVEVCSCRRGERLPGDAALVVLPGSKIDHRRSAEFRDNGWESRSRAHVARGGQVVGICGGYQMLGRRVRDPQGIEGTQREIAGLGLLDIETVLKAKRPCAMSPRKPPTDWRSKAMKSTSDEPWAGLRPADDPHRRPAGRRHIGRWQGSAAAICTGCSVPMNTGHGCWRNWVSMPIRGPGGRRSRRHWTNSPPRSRRILTWMACWVRLPRCELCRFIAADVASGLTVGELVR